MMPYETECMQSLKQFAVQEVFPTYELNADKEVFLRKGAIEYQKGIYKHDITIYIWLLVLKRRNIIPKREYLVPKTVALI